MRSCWPRAAFVDAVQLAALVGAAVVAFACVLSARLLRDRSGGAAAGTHQAAKEVS